MYDLSGIQDRLTIAVLGGIWKDKKCETNGNVEFRGMHTIHNTSSSDENWSIWKITRDENGNKLREEGPLTGSWDNRKSLGWDDSYSPSFSVLGYDKNIRDLLDISRNIFIELKKINMQLNIITDNYIKE